MAAWLAWAIAAVLLAVGEIFTPGLFFLGPVALAAVAAAVVAAVGAAVWLQLVVFAGASLASLAVPAADRAGASADAGRDADRYGGARGRARRRAAARRRATAAACASAARSGRPAPTCPTRWSRPGTQVEVVKIEGATALVYE